MIMGIKKETGWFPFCILLFFTLLVRFCLFQCGLHGSVEACDTDGAEGTCFVDGSRLVEGIKVYILRSNIDILEHTFLDEFLRTTVYSHPLKCGLGRGTYLIIDVMVI